MEFSKELYLHFIESSAGYREGNWKVERLIKTLNEKLRRKTKYCRKTIRVGCVKNFRMKILRLGRKARNVSIGHRIR